MKLRLIKTSVCVRHFWCWPCMGGNAANIFADNGCNSSRVCTQADVPGSYFKCSNSFNSYSCSTSAIMLTYTSITRRSGTSVDPHILSGCAFSSCACSAVQYLSGTTCSDCPKTMETQMRGAPAGEKYHVKTTCEYCDYNNYIDSFTPAPGVTVKGCRRCPSGGQSDGKSGISSCCIPAGTKGASDTTGTFDILSGAQCCY